VPFAAGVNRHHVPADRHAPLPAARQSVIILNKPGAGGTIGMSESPAPHRMDTRSRRELCLRGKFAVLKKLPFDPLKDFAPITMVARAPLVLLVNTKTPPRTVPEFINWVKSKPPESSTTGRPDR